MVDLAVKAPDKNPSQRQHSAQNLIFLLDVIKINPHEENTSCKYHHLNGLLKRPLKNEEQLN